MINTPPEQFQQLLQTNLQAPLALVQQLLPLLDGGLVINMGGAAVEYTLVNQSAPAYQISKSALLGITRSLALELASRHIRVNMISPGHLENSVDLPEDIQSNFPLNRTGTVEGYTICNRLFTTNKQLCDGCQY